MKLPTFYEVYCKAYDSHTYETDTETCGRYLYKSKALKKFRELREEVKQGWDIDEEWNIIVNQRDYFNAEYGDYKYEVTVGIREHEGLEIDESKE